MIRAILAAALLTVSFAYTSASASVPTAQPWSDASPTQWVRFGENSSFLLNVESLRVYDGTVNFIVGLAGNTDVRYGVQINCDKNTMQFKYQGKTDSVDEIDDRLPLYSTATNLRDAYCPRVDKLTVINSMIKGSGQEMDTSTFRVSGDTLIFTMRYLPFEGSYQMQINCSDFSYQNTNSLSGSIVYKGKIDVDSWESEIHHAFCRKQIRP